MTILRAFLISTCLAVLISLALDYTYDVSPVRVQTVRAVREPVRPEVVYGNHYPTHPFSH